MLNIKRIFTFLTITSMTVLAACGATTAADGDATDGTGSDATIDNDTTAGDTMGDMSMAVTYKSIVIWDKSQEKPAKCGNSPGTDLDALGLYRGGKLVAVGKPGTANYTAPASPLKDTAGTSCVAGDGKNSAASAAGPLDGHVYASNPDTGYISLNGGSLEIQFGACVTGSTITDCDGAGSVVEVMSGDEIDVWEVDGSYKAGSGTAADGNAYAGCACYADEYQVDLRPAIGSEAGSVYVPSDPNQYDKGSMTVKVP